MSSHLFKLITMLLTKSRFETFIGNLVHAFINTMTYYFYLKKFEVTKVN